EIDSLARGRVWTGGQAYERSLVDTPGGFETAIALGKKKAGVAPGAEGRYVVYPKGQRPFFPRLLGQLWDEPAESPATALDSPRRGVVRCRPQPGGPAEPGVDALHHRDPLTPSLPRAPGSGRSPASMRPPHALE